MKDTKLQDAEHLGSVIRMKRQEKGLSQADLASQLGVERKWVLRLEAGNPAAEVGLVLKGLEAVGIQGELFDSPSDNMGSSEVARRHNRPEAPALPGLITYGISGSKRAPLLEFMVSALEAAGCRILNSPNPSSAPFVLVFETPANERMGIVAYAFLATRTPTKNRPANERSFQLKYGSKITNKPQWLWIDTNGVYTTLLLGIDPDEGFFVAADPAAHNPTKFFIRIEFNDEHAEALGKKSWHAWERSKRMTVSGEPFEVLVGGAKRHFLQLIRFERQAINLAPSARKLLAEQMKPE
jgi:transcriptional regulator with XRE-family HTH domain